MQNQVKNEKPRVVSAITATGTLTIGNYIGALSAWTAAQDNYDSYLFIADLHALTVPENVNAVALRRRIVDVAALYLACGLDPEKSVLFRQSHVPNHATLAWIINCITPIGWLERMTQFKSKGQATSPSAGLLTYPSLMAADILLYQADYVPVGDDQRQHIEIARDIAQRFNHLFGETFKLPQSMIRASGARIMSLDDPSIKMSKSLAETRKGHAIGLLDSSSDIRDAVMRAVTDSGTEIRGDDLSPGVDNLLSIYGALAKLDREETLGRFEGKRYGSLKKSVADLAIECVEQIQGRFTQIRADERLLDEVLQDGAEKAMATSKATMDTVMHQIGLN